MTNFEKSRLESFNSHAISEGKVKKGIGADNGIMASHGQGVTFADSLHSVSSQVLGIWSSDGEENASVISDISGVPSDWTYKGYWGYYASVMGVKEYMKNALGIDPDDRVFTHEITEEQREWLSSRHDMEALKNAGVNSREFGNYMADLYYLGVYSAGEVMTLCSPNSGAEPELSLEGQNGVIMKTGELNDYYEPIGEDADRDFVKKIVELHMKRFDRLKNEVEYTELDDTELKRLRDFLNNKQTSGFQIGF